VKTGIDEIIKDCQRKRRDGYDRLQRNLTKEDLADLTEIFDEAVSKSLRQHEIFPVTSVEEAGRFVIEKALDRFVKNTDAIYHPFAVRRIHRLRIAGKHLRYAIELFEELWDGKLEPFVEQTKRMQSHLGRIHDRDFWIAGSGKRISAAIPQTKKEKAIYQARVWLLSEFIRQRMRAYRDAFSTWNEWKSEDLPGQLSEVIARNAAAVND
jgi:CHAD domain-containing protein